MTYDDMVEKTFENVDKVDCENYFDVFSLLGQNEMLWYKAEDGLILFRKENHEHFLFYFFYDSGHVDYSFFKELDVQKFYIDQKDLFYIPGLKLNLQLYH